jgi:hypothetical protein
MARFKDLGEEEVWKDDGGLQRGGTAAQFTGNIHIRAQRQMMRMALNACCGQQADALGFSHCFWKKVTGEFFPSHNRILLE